MGLLELFEIPKIEVTKKQDLRQIARLSTIAQNFQTSGIPDISGLIFRNKNRSELSPSHDMSIAIRSWGYRFFEALLPLVIIRIRTSLPSCISHRTCTYPRVLLSSFSGTAYWITGST